MILIKYLDLYDSYYNEAGDMVSELIAENVTIPFTIDLDDIIEITPYMTKSGKLYKNVSLVETRYNKTYKVVGNYKTLNELRINPPKKQIGYAKEPN